MRQVMASKRIKALALVLVAATIVALPLTGCGKKEPAPSGTPAPAPTGNTGAGTSGGSTSGGTTGGTGGSGSGSETWEAFHFKAGEHLKYTISINDGSQTTEGWFSYDFSDAGGGKLNLAYAGSYAEQAFSGTVQVSGENALSDLQSGLTSDPFAMMALIPLVMIPWDYYFADRDLIEGNTWTYSAGGASVTFKVAGTATYAGIEGRVGTWTATNEGVTTTAEFCVSPSFPMALHVKVNDPTSTFEYTLTEASGF